MTLLTITVDTWLLAGISIATVFCILIILVLVLQLFGLMGEKECVAAASSKTQAQPLASASEEEQAAVAVALYLYQNDAHDQESGVLTLRETPSYWHSELNPTFDNNIVE